MYVVPSRKTEGAASFYRLSGWVFLLQLYILLPPLVRLLLPFLLALGLLTAAHFFQFAAVLVAVGSVQSIDALGHIMRIIIEDPAAETPDSLKNKNQN